MTRAWVRSSAVAGRLCGWLAAHPLTPAVLAFWLAGYWFFHDGFWHRLAFWALVAPAVVIDAAVPEGGWRRLARVGGRPSGWLWMLLGGQLVAGMAGGAGWHGPSGVIEALAAAWEHRDMEPIRRWHDPCGVIDTLAMVLLAIAVAMVAGSARGWLLLRQAMVAAAVPTTIWCLLAFYPWAGEPLTGERFRHLIIYGDGLNAVLTGLLAGFAMVAAVSLDHRGIARVLRPALWAGIAVLAFALLASQSRGAMLAATAGLGIHAARCGRQALPGVLAAVAGVLAFLVAYAVVASGASPALDLLSRGDTGRTLIWHEYLGRISGRDWLLGHGTVDGLPADLLGWFAHHPHSGYLTQIVQCGLPGLVLLLGWLAGALAMAWRRPAGDGVMAMLVFGMVGMLADGAQILSLASLPRIEPLIVAVPALAAWTASYHARHINARRMRALHVSDSNS